MLDFWATIAGLVNKLTKMNMSDIQLYKEEERSCIPIQPVEETELTGFIPLMNLSLKVKYIHRDADMVNIRVHFPQPM